MDKQKVDINVKLCLVYQCVKDEDLGENPTSYDKLVAAVKEKASYKTFCRYDGHFDFHCFKYLL